MNHKRDFLIGFLPLLCMACADMSTSSKEDTCRRQAENRLELYNKPDIFPISEKDRYNALTALFYECMRTPDAKLDYKYEIDTKNAKPAAVPAPAAPAPAPTPAGNVASYPAGTVVIVQSPPAVYNTASPSGAESPKPPETIKIIKAGSTERNTDPVVPAQRLYRYPPKGIDDDSRKQLENIISGNR